MISTSFERAVDLLGGQRLLQRRVAGPMDAHDMILVGIPSEAMGHLLGNLSQLRMASSVERAVGMSVRTMQRRREAPGKLNQEQSGKAWKFAEILALATEIMGSQAAAESWLEAPAIGLDQHKPIDLLGTPAGTEMVEALLGRLKYGVYT